MNPRELLPCLLLLPILACRGGPGPDASMEVPQPTACAPAESPLPVPVVWRDEETGEEFLGTLRSAHLGVDALGLPALHAELVETQHAAFRAWTGERIGHRVSLLVDGVVLTSPVVQDALPGKMVVSGGAPDGFGTEEVEAWVAFLNQTGNSPR